MIQKKKVALCFKCWNAFAFNFEELINNNWKDLCCLDCFQKMEYKNLDLYIFPLHKARKPKWWWYKESSYKTILESVEK